MSYSSIFDPNLYNISHHQNRIFVCAQKSEIVYYKSPKTIRPPRVQVTFCVKHHLVPDDIPQPHYHDGVRAYVSQPRFNQPLRALASAGEAGPAFEAMLSRLKIPFDLRPSEEHGPLIWGHGHRLEINNRPFGDSMAARLSKACERILREAAAEADPRAVKEFHVVVFIMKRTIVEAELYHSLPHEILDVEFEAAVELLNTVTYGGDDDIGSDDNSECAICLNDFISGTQVSGLPCSHWFHEDCIVTWFKTSQTCPTCRFELVPPTLDTN